MLTPSSISCSSTRPTPPRIRPGWSSCCARSGSAARTTEAPRPAAPEPRPAAQRAKGTIEVVADGRAIVDRLGRAEDGAGRPARDAKHGPGHARRRRRRPRRRRGRGPDGAAQVQAILLSAIGGRSYEHVMLIDGNDDRGIDVGLLTHERLPIGVHPLACRRRGRPAADLQPRLSRVRRRARRRRAHSSSWSTTSRARATARASRTTRRERDRRTASRRSTQRARADGEENVVVLGDFNDYPARRRSHRCSRNRPPRHHRPTHVRRRRPARAPSATAPRRQDRLHPVLARALGQRHRWRHLAQGRVGRQERHDVAALPTCGQQCRRQRPLRDLRRPRPLATPR